MSELIKSGAANHRGTSKQDYATPDAFIQAVERKFGKIQFDLAASGENRKAEHYFDEPADSLKQAWGKLRGLLWLNPPFGNIAPWAAKCAATMREPGIDASLLFLVPASVDSNWWAEHVHVAARSVYFCNPRLSFDGKSPFPKPMALVHYLPGWRGTDYSPWRWK